MMLFYLFYDPCLPQGHHQWNKWQRTSNRFNKIGRLISFRAARVCTDTKATNHRGLNFQEWNHTRIGTSCRQHRTTVSAQEGRCWCPELPARAEPRWRAHRSRDPLSASCSPEPGLPPFLSWGLIQSHWMCLLCWSKNTYTLKTFRTYELWGLEMVNTASVHQKAWEMCNIKILPDLNPFERHIHPNLYKI